MSVRDVLSLFFLLFSTCSSLFTQPVTDSQGDVGIGTIAPDPSALFELRSTTKGFLMPRMTSAQRNGINDPATGLMIYNTEDSVIQWNWGTEFSPLWYTVVGVDTAGRLVAQLSPGAIWYGGSDSNAAELQIGSPGDFLTVNSTGTAPEWISASAAPFWGLSGNGGTTPGGNYVGTSDDVDFVLATNGVERGRFYSSTNGGGFGITGPFRPNGNPGTTNQVLTSQGSGSPPAWSSDLNVDNINASGDVGVAGDLDVDGSTSLDDLTVDGPSSLNGQTTVNDDLSVTGTTDLQGDANVGGNLDVTGNATVGGDLDVDGATTLDDVTVDGTQTNTGDVSFTGTNFTTSGGTTSTFNGPVNINSDVVIDGDLSNTGNAVIASDPGSNATVGNTTGTTIIQGSTTNVDGNDVNIGSTATTVDIGNSGSTTTIDGTVVFTNAPELPLSEDALFVGNNLDVAVELPTTNDEGAVLQQDASGTPVWSSGLNVDNIVASGDLDVDGATTLDDVTVDGTQTNTGDVSFTGTSFTTSGGTTSTFNGPVNINSDVVIDGDLSNTGNAVIASDPGSNATVGNTTGTTTLQGATTNVDGNDVNVGSTATTVDIGNSGSTTTIDGTVVFTNAPELPLSEDALFVGNNLDVATELATTNDEGAVLQQDASGTPVWSSDLNVDNIAASGDLDVDGATTLDDVTVDGTQTNTGDVSFTGANFSTGNSTTSTFNGPVNINDDVVIDGSLSNSGDVNLATDPSSITIIGTGTGSIDVQGSVTSISTVNVNPSGGPEASVTIGYNDNDGAGPDEASTTSINGNVNLGSPVGNNGGPTLLTVEGDALFNGEVSFANLPDLPLSEHALFVGDNTNIASELLSTNEEGALLQQDATGMPVWSRDLNVENVTVTGDMSVDGATTLQELIVNEEATFNDEVTFNGSPVTVNSADFTTSNGTTSTFNGPVNINNDLTIDGDLSNTGDVNLGSTTGSNVTIGNTGGVTVLDGSTLVIGNAGSTTTIDGDVTFTNSPEFPLTDNAIWVGGVQGNSGIAEELFSTNSEGAVLQQDANGTPVWSRDLDVDNLAVIQDLIVEGSSTLGDGNDDITINAGTGNITLQSLTVDASPGAVVSIDGAGHLTQTSTTDLSTVLSGTIAVSRNATLVGNGTSGSPLGINLANGNTWTALQTFSSVDVNGGTIDGTAIGGTTAALGRFTVLRSSGTTELGDGNDNVTINVGTAELTLTGIDVDASPTSVLTINGSNQVRETTLSDLATELSDQVSVSTNATLTGDGTSGNPLGLNLANPNNWTGAQTFSSVDVNGGTIDIHA
ncbi:MAG: beta strand repeat-containing protein, partial [Candidatus Kapaibacterium sp.]